MFFLIKSPTNSYAILIVYQQKSLHWYYALQRITVLWIRDILVRIRTYLLIHICRSVFADPYHWHTDLVPAFLSVADKMPTKIKFFPKIFAYYF
jgi:hypothetical protein